MACWQELEIGASVTEGPRRYAFGSYVENSPSFLSVAELQMHANASSARAPADAASSAPSAFWPRPLATSPETQRSTLPVKITPPAEVRLCRGSLTPPRRPQISLCHSHHHTELHTTPRQAVIDNNAQASLLSADCRAMSRPVQLMQEGHYP